MKNACNLTLRQRKLIHYMQNHTKLVTGQELAAHLHVSPRTVRNDVLEINRNLKQFDARIHSIRSKGYYLEAKDLMLLQKLNQIDNAFLTKEDRVRYLALRLCFSNEPLNTYDLEDEMFVSHTTLEHDIRQLKVQYMLSDPYIRLYYSKNHLYFENNERKIRSLLVKSFHNDWNYQTHGNAYYGYQFIENEHMDHILHTLPVHLKAYNIILDDPTLIALNLEIAIMYYRIKDGHFLPFEEISTPDPTAANVTRNLFRSLEEYFHISFPENEQNYICNLISASRFITRDELDKDEPVHSFDSHTVEIAHAYLDQIFDTFRIDLRKDEDFFITLLFFIRDLENENRLYNVQKNIVAVYAQLLNEMEIAYLFQDISIRFLQRFITQAEIQYLAHLISGALDFLFETHPEFKIRTAICCHLNPAAYWYMKRKLLSSFDKFLNIVALMPINAEQFFDFQKLDLIITTVNKAGPRQNNCDVIQVNSLISPADHLLLTDYILKKRIESLCPKSNYTLTELLENAFWREKESADKPFFVIETLAGDFHAEGIVDEFHIQELLRKEAFLSAALRPGILFLYFPRCAKQTRLSVMTLDHRIKWNTFKIRTIVLGSFRKEDFSLLFHLNHIFHSDAHCNPEQASLLKTKRQLLDYFHGL